MRIRRLEIQGFKSFADRMQLSFGQGITGVVGPNGCGKSNVVDALRWVMGEQSAKHLRGASMQDVIFNGSDTRGPLGMAEVTVTFENDGNAPAEYSHYPEIQVTRRLFRTGDSDYLINKTPCRLRDIHELFLGTGIGTKAYSIIEQGQVSTLIKAKPEDRRRVIEEAAGITKYKARRQAAERKMEATRQNLLRITDVTNEISRRLGSLRRAARKAERYKELKKEVREVELHQAALRFLELITSLEYARSTAGNEEERLTSDEARVAELEARIETERLGLVDEKERLEKAQARLYEVENQISLSEQQKEHAATTLEMGERREQEGRQEIESLSEALEMIRTQKEELALGAEELLAVADADEDALQDAQNRANQLSERRSEITRKTERLRNENMSSLTLAAQLRTQITSIQERSQEQRERREALEEELYESEGVLEELSERASAYEEEHAAAESERGMREERRQHVLGRMEEMRANISTLERKILETRELVGERRSRLSSLEEISSSYERSPEGVRALMQRAAMDTDRFAGVVGLLADVFEAPEGYEICIEASLGDALQSVVVNNSAAARACFGFLQDTEQGRATLVVEDVLTPPPDASGRLQHIPGIEPLAAHVVPKSGHESLVQNIFGRIWLAHTLEDAIAAWPHVQEHRLVLVTREGVVFRPDATVSGGSSSGADSGLLRQKREIRELREALEILETELEERLEEKENHSIQLTEMSQEADRLAEDIQRLTLLSLERKQETARAKDDIARHRQRRDERQAEKSKLSEQETRLREEVMEKQAQLEEAEVARSSHDEELAEAGELSAQLDAELHQATEALTQLKVRVAAQAERRTTLKQSIDHQERNETDARGRLEKIKQQLEDIRGDRERLLQNIRDAEEKVAALLGERVDLKEGLDKDRTAYEVAAQKVRQQESDLRTTRARVDALRKHLNTVAIQVREKELELDSLAQRIQSAHGVLPQEVVYDYHLLPLPDEGNKKRVADLRRQIDQMGEINLTAIDEAKELEERYNFLKSQSDDLTHALTQLEKAIIKINRTTKKRFLEAYEAINERFQQVFPRLFRGGKAWLSLTDSQDLLSTGVEIYAQPPGKKLGSVVLMSGGEQALTAVSLIFAIFLIKPSPFCLLDEVDAPLDEANVGRFNEMIRDVSSISQFIVITHNKRTMEAADQLYGVTMEEPGVSKMVNVRMN